MSKYARAKTERVFVCRWFPVKTHTFIEVHHAKDSWQKDSLTAVPAAFSAQLLSVQSCLLFVNHDEDAHQLMRPGETHDNKI